MSDPRDRQEHDGRPPQQNVKPKMSSSSSSSSHQHQKADQRQKEKPSKVRRSRSIDSGPDRGRRRDRHQQEDRRPRGRSEESRRGGDTGRRRKPVPEDDREETECAICFCSYDNIFKTPKLLSCGHTFCLECLARINVTSRELKSLPCPVCREITEIPHGQDLPRLGTNRDIIQKLPPQMQRILSIRFKRSQGKLMVKSHHQQEAPPTSPTKLTPFKKLENQVSPAGEGVAVDVERGGQTQTVIDVGRPPSRVRGRLRRLFRSERCYYAVVVSVITITVLLMLIGILAFVIIPNVVHSKPPLTGNNSSEGNDHSP